VWVFVSEKFLSGSDSLISGSFSDSRFLLSQLKVLYSCCHVSLEICQRLLGDHQAVQSVLSCVEGEVDLWDVPRVHIAEVSLFLVSVVVLRLQSLPDTLSPVCGALPRLLTCPVPSLVAAASVVAASLYDCGEPDLVTQEVLLSAMRVCLTETPPVTVCSPLGSGLHDWTFHLLLQQITQDEEVIAVLSEESPLLWRSICLILGFGSPRAQLEGDTPRANHCKVPNWSLLSVRGVVTFLHVSLMISVKCSDRFLRLLGDPQSVVMLVLNRLVSPAFLGHVTEVCHVIGWDVSVTLSDLVCLVSQLLCIPLSQEVLSPTLRDIESSLLEHQTLSSLIQVILLFTPPPSSRSSSSSSSSSSLIQVCTDLPLGLVEMPLSVICRLVLMNESFVSEFSLHVGSSSHVISWMGGALLSELDNVVLQLLPLLSHLLRSSPDHLPLVQNLVEDWDTPLCRFLQTSGAELRAAACTLAGNFGRVGQCVSGRLMERLLECLCDRDSRTRRTAAFAVGNYAFRKSCAEETWLPAATDKLLPLLKDPQAKTRIHAANALGNLGLPAPERGRPHPLLRVPQELLHTACTDREEPVRLASIIALRSLSGHAHVRQVTAPSLAPPTSIITLRSLSDHTHIRQVTAPSLTPPTSIIALRSLSGHAHVRQVTAPSLTPPTSIIALRSLSGHAHVRQVTAPSLTPPTSIIALRSLSGHAHVRQVTAPSLAPPTSIITLRSLSGHTHIRQVTAPSLTPPTSIIALRSLSGHAHVRQRLVDLNAEEKLSSSLTCEEKRPSPRRSSLTHHCNRLLHRLTSQIA
ncbi:serine/threonine-protein kinase 36-like, partial [Mantella aurantiaca]